MQPNHVFDLQVYAHVPKDRVLSAIRENCFSFLQSDSENPGRIIPEWTPFRRIVYLQQLLFIKMRVTNQFV